MVDEQEVRLQEALEALTAFQLDEEENEYTNDNELLLSLQNIEPLPLVEDSDIHVYEIEDYGNSDPLTILNPEIIALLSIDDEGGSNRSTANNLAVTKEKSSPITIEKDTANYTDISTPNTTTTATDSLPDIEIDFGDDSFLVDSNQLYSVFDEDFNDDGSRNKDINVVIEKEEGDKREDTGSVDELTGKKYPSISGQEQHRSSYKEEDLFENSIAADFILDIDLETEELYKELANMSLYGHTNDSSDTHSVINNSGNYNNNDVSNDDAANAIVAEDLLTQMDATGTDGTDGLPFYLVCQPCCEDGTNDDNHDNTIDEGNSNYSSIYGADQFRSLDHSLPPITEDQPLNDEAESEAVRHEREQHIRDLRELYVASSRRDEQQDLIPLDHSDPLLIELEAQREATEDIQLEDYPEEDDEMVRDAAKYWTEAFGIKLDERTSVSNTTVPISSNDTSNVCYGHKETIYGVSFSEDGKHVATASQDATIGIWDVGTNRLLKSLKGHDTNYECLRVDWASKKWADQILDRSIRFANILASSAADGTVKLWSCEEMKDRDQCMNTWKCEYSLDHSGILSQGTTSDEKGGENSGESVKEESSTKVENNNDNDDKAQVYSLQFIDHWKVFTKDIRQQQQQCPHHPQQEQHEARVLNDDDDDKNSFLMTSSDEFIHLWEVPSHPYDQQLKLDDQKIRILQEDIKLKEVMSLHFGPLDQYGFGVTACSITGTGLQLPPPPKAKQNLDGNQMSFGGKRNPSNIIFVFDASYSPASGLLGVALADGSLRLVNGRGICISVINLPGNRSHLTSFSWSSCGTRLTTCAATGHMLAWSLDPESHEGGNRHTIATCTAIFEGGHQPGRPLFGSRYCGGPDENLLLSWGVDGKMCLWYSNARGNIYDPVAILKNNSDYPIYAVEISKSEQNVAVCGGDEGGFVGIPFHLYNLPTIEKIQINKEKDTDQ